MRVRVRAVGVIMTSHKVSGASTCLIHSSAEHTAEEAQAAQEYGTEDAAHNNCDQSLRVALLLSATHAIYGTLAWALRHWHHYIISIAIHAHGNASVHQAGVTLPIAIAVVPLPVDVIVAFTVHVVTVSLCADRQCQRSND